MTRYFANHKVNKNQISSGFDTLEEAKEQAEFLAETYGGVAKASANVMDATIYKYSAAKGWH